MGAVLLLLLVSEVSPSSRASSSVGEKGLRKGREGEVPVVSCVEVGEALRMEVSEVLAAWRRHSGYSSSKRWIMRSRVESRNLRRP